MPISSLTILIFLFFVTSAVGVVTGSNSLITVPVMFQFGIEPKVAVATNMFGLTFLNIGASLSFYRHGSIEFRRLSPLAAITVAASALGAMLIGSFSSAAVPVFVTASMIFVVGFTLVRRDAGLGKGAGAPGRGAITLTILLTFLLGVYGGMFSGGYVTMLTAVLVGFYGMSFSEAVAGTKFVNVFSSAIASAVFAWQGLIDYSLGIILAVTMFVAAYVGARTVTRLNDLWLRRIFLTAVVLLAVKTAMDFIF